MFPEFAPASFQKKLGCCTTIGRCDFVNQSGRFPARFHQDGYRHVPTGTLARLAAGLGRVFTSPTTWYRLVRAHQWLHPEVTAQLLLDTSKSMASDKPMVLVDEGVDNFNFAVDRVVASGLLKRVLAQTEIDFSNSLIESWWRVLKHR